MARAKLDKSRDYGTITGDVYGRAYEQDGKTFSQDGDEVIVTNSMRLAQVAKEAEAAAESGDDKDAVIARLSAQLARQAAQLEGKDAAAVLAAEKDAKIDELRKQTEANEAKLKGAKTSEVDAQLAKQ